MIEVTQDLVGSGLSGGYDGGGPKLIIHTTEGGGADGPEQFAARNLARIRSTHDAILATWRRGSGYPSHLLVTVQLRLAVQCLPFTSPAPTLEDKVGGIRPNRAGAPLLQWEVVGHAAQLDDEWNADDWAWFGALIRQECARHGIPDAFPFPFLSSPSPAYGPTQWGGGAARLDAETFRNAAGVLGHQHVPENLHSDPGVLRLDLMQRLALPPPFPPPDLGTNPPPSTGVTDMAQIWTIGGTLFRVDGGRAVWLPGRTAEEAQVATQQIAACGGTKDLVHTNLRLVYLDGEAPTYGPEWAGFRVTADMFRTPTALPPGGATPAAFADELARRLTT